MNKKAQVWIETVIYTLIGLAVIGIVLTFATPKIEAIRDKAIIEQTINALSDIDNKIAEMSAAVGNTRTLSLSLKKGELTFDCANNRIEFILRDTKYVYSQPNQDVSVMDLNIGKIEARTEQDGENNIRLWIDYKTKLSLECGNKEEIILSKASVPYSIFLDNKDLADGINVIEISVS